jgi:hypothetical protein
MSFIANENIIAGQAVEICNRNSSSDIAIRPISYNITSGITDFVSPVFAGIALSNTVAGQSCNVCIRGITTVLCTNIVGPYDSAVEQSTLNQPGFVSSDGKIFQPNQLTDVTNEYIRAGFFMENNQSLITGNLALFNVNPKMSAF